ncbi:MAG: hypothetical protein HY824_03825 [Acidobacteria bacterium]|nr:hypothetical protein [Acidobacteriota bacterium]
MGCAKHFLNFQWEHHRWRKRVTGAEKQPAPETNMWGRVVHSTYVRCHKEDVCEVCGTTRRDMNCICDTAYGEHCAIRRAWLDQAEHPPA